MNPYTIIRFSECDNGIYYYYTLVRFNVTNIELNIYYFLSNVAKNKELFTQKEVKGADISQDLKQLIRCQSDQKRR